jgi:hypothetical protein
LIFEQPHLAVVGWQFNGFADKIDQPAQNNFKGAPTGVIL